MGSEWNSIETAPKDGTRILVGRFVEKCRYDRNDVVRVDRYWQPGERSFVGWAHFNNRAWPPTHWMPLPPSPTGAKDNG